eukprot:10285579-Lingulodinium_polyedra.AAC.1
MRAHACSRGRTRTRTTAGLRPVGDEPRPTWVESEWNVNQPRMWPLAGCKGPQVAWVVWACGLPA